jgi:hypothetical protein
MRRLALAASLLALAACQREATPQSAGAKADAGPETTAAPSPQVPPAPVSNVEGWETGKTSYPMLGSTLPDFSVKRVGGGDVTQRNLRGRWTILGFWTGSGDGAKEEMTYIGALNSAADQDPDLDLLTIYLDAGGGFDLKKWAAGADAWPTATGDAAIADAFGIPAPPAYLLVGPDLTIEAYRGALSKTPADGVKPVLRGVAEIKKQIAAPE